ncbi:Ankyrin repeat and LEM domain-containing protein 1 [Halotydeus destructor]|nr:Ankyrin repeat and LEM domain-containing protein 1 [Halotydeus destructor]
MTCSNDLLQQVLAFDVTALKKITCADASWLTKPLIVEDHIDLYPIHILAGLPESEDQNKALLWLLSNPSVDVNQQSGSGNEFWTAADIAVSWGRNTTLNILENHVSKLNDENSGSSSTILYFTVDDVADQTDAEMSVKLLSINESVLKLDKKNVRYNLELFGEKPGPLLPSTEMVLRRKLQILRSQVPYTPLKILPLPTHSDELKMIEQGQLNIRKAEELEAKLSDLFRTENSMNSFNYLLLDSRLTSNIPIGRQRHQKSDFTRKFFKSFTDAIFYVGKGNRNRPREHLKEALKVQSLKIKPPNGKIKTILDIFNQELAVIIVRCSFAKSSPEALARERFMIEALTLEKLTNVQIGQNKATDSYWNEARRKSLGAYLLYKAFHSTFLVTGGIAIKKTDL